MSAPRGACALACALGLWGGGCSALSGLETKLETLTQLTREARDRGAYRCAPEELARAVAHLEFAGHELDQADLRRARQHLVLADSNARAALRLSDDAACKALGAPGAEAHLRVTPRIWREPAAARAGLVRSNTARRASAVPWE